MPRGAGPTSRARITAAALAATLAATGAACTGGDADRDGDAADRPPEETVRILDEGAWRMHHIDGRYRGANALGAADVDGDGRRDYVTNYEFDQRWVLALHPGDDASVRASWPTVEVWRPDPLVQGSGKNPESAALGDFDGDGNVDAVGAHGFSDLPDFEGSAPGIHLVWGPEPDRVRDADAWTDAGWVPATVDLGHPHWVVGHDVNGDGLTDVVYGGRRHGGAGGYDLPDLEGGNGSLTGIAWLEAPAKESERRDLSRWQLHHIDASTPSGHGFVFADLDGDGDDDIVDANADFDTPEDQEQVFWYRNPGDGTDAQRREWPRTTLEAEVDFYAKPSVAVGDLDGDDDADIVTQTDDELVLFRNDGGETPGFDTVVLAKPEQIAWRSRPVRLADMDRDGDLDLVGMLVHEDGDLPADKAAAYLMLNEGRPFEESGWRLLPVKWGSGTTMLIPGFGEKWDQVDVTDVDGDGDLDLVANCEEWWVEPQGEVAPFFTRGLATQSVAVVWFENRLDLEPQVHAERDGVVEIQAEDTSVIGDSTWVTRAPVRADDSATVALQAFNGLVPEGGVVAADATEGTTYRVFTEGGDYTVWARVWEPSVWAPELGGDASDSAWLSFDGATGSAGGPLVVGDATGGPVDSWSWVRVPGTVTLPRGEHDVTLRVRERGVAVDQLVLSTDPDTVPGG